MSYKRGEKIVENVLVTGITGKSGSFLLKQMINEQDRLSNVKVKALVRRESDATELDKANFIEKVYGNLNNESDLISVFKEHKVDTLLHIAGIRQSENIIKAALSRGEVSRLILVHTTGIFSKYKAAGEDYRQIERNISEMIKDKNISLTILRPTMIYGDLNDRNISVFIDMVYRLRIFPVVDHAAYELQPVHAKDLGSAYFEILSNPEKTKNKNYNLSGGRPIMLKEMLKTISRYLGVKNTFISIPFGIAYAGACILYAVSFSKIDYREKVQRLVETRTFSYEDAKNDFGYSPMCFEEGVKSEVQEYLKFKKKGK